MTRRSLPKFEPLKPIRAPHLNKLGSELGRLTGLPTGGDELYVDNACGRFPVGRRRDSGRPFRVRITQVEDDPYDYGYPTAPIAVYATSHEYGLDVVRVNDADEDVGAEFTAYPDPWMYGVHWTDRIVRVEQRGGETYITQGGQENWYDGFTVDAIDVDGTGQVQLFTSGPVVTATTRTGIAADTFCRVFFDTQAQLFFVFGQDCPAEPA